MGAKGQGCGGGTDDPTPVECGVGFHLEDTCLMRCAVPAEGDIASAPAPCEETCGEQQCVPDQICPDGSEAQTVCGVPIYSSSDSTGCAESGETGCIEPPVEECWTECVPANPCGEGYHEEWVCSTEPQPLSDSGSGDAPTVPEDCYATCVPDLCGPGYIAQTICEETVSSGSGGSGGSSGVDCTDPNSDCVTPPSGNCWTECIPVDPCPQGYHEETVCDDVVSSDSGSGSEPMPPGSCVTSCVLDYCPEGYALVEICTVDESGSGRCWSECEPTTPPVEPDEPIAS
jgi:hypothetical protein